MNKKGFLSVEALINVVVIMLVLTVLTQLLMFYGREDHFAQHVMDSVVNLEHQNYMYEKVGILNYDFSDYLDNIDPSIAEILVNFQSQTYEGVKLFFLESIFELQLGAYESKHITNICIERFELMDGLNLKLSYDHKLPLGFVRQGELHLHQSLWLFGNQPDVFDHTSLADLLSLTEDEEDHTSVYCTKTGQKYHTKDCFYVNRSTTDKEQIQTLTISQAKARGMTPCSRCITKEAKPWK